MSDITRNTTLPDTAAKADFHNLIDTATVQRMKPATDSTTALQLQNAAETAILNVDTTNSRIGIGITSPTSILEIVNTGTGVALGITQSGVLAASTPALSISSSGANVNSGSSLLQLNQTSGSSTQRAAYIVNAGTGHALNISQDGVLAASQNGLYIYSNQIQINAPLVYLRQDNAGSSAQLFYIDNDGTGGGLELHQNTELAASHYGLYIYSPVVQTNSPLALFKSTHADTTKATVAIEANNNDASDKCIGLVINVDNAGNGDQIAIDIDQVDEAKSYFARFDATTAWTSAKNPESEAEAGWIKIMVGTAAYFLPYYAAS